MKLSEIYRKLESYDFSEFDVCSKTELADMFICHILGISLSKFKLTKIDIDLSDSQAKKLFEYIDKVIYDKMPPQYVISKVYIYNEEYFVTEDVLIPRQDTEVLIEKAVEYINRYNLKKCLDMCTGSGVVGISVAKNSKIEKVDLVDVSKKALEVAKRNIQNNMADKKVLVKYSNLFENLMTSKDKYDIIVSNPPYIKSMEIEKLSDYVKKEPLIALDGGDTGLAFYEKITERARNFLNDNGFLMFEIGYDQMEELTKIFEKYPEYEILEKVKDYNLMDRVIICRFHKI